MESREVGLVVLQPQERNKTKTFSDNQEGGKKVVPKADN